MTRDWPVRSTEAADALRDIVNACSHVVRHMPVYDLTGELIDPLQYSNKLTGATVVVRFTLQHFVIKKRRMGIRSQTMYLLGPLTTSALPSIQIGKVL